MARGSLGVIRFGNDFTSVGFDAFVPTATGLELGGGVGFYGVNEGALAFTVDEPGGVLDITTDVGDDDNNCLVAGTFKPADGGMWMETRFKITDSVATTRAAVWCGFTETLSVTTPVMPVERTGTTNTFNAGGSLGVMFDSDSTILRFFATAADGSAALAGKNSKTAAVVTAGVLDLANTMTADRWYVVRVEIAPNGLGRVLFGDIDTGDPLETVFENTTALGTGDNFHACLMIENRSAANERLEVDYFTGEGYRDWAVD